MLGRKGRLGHNACHGYVTDMCMKFTIGTYDVLLWKSDAHSGSVKGRNFLDHLRKY
jgi:hypothetical protein